MKKMKKNRWIPPTLSNMFDNCLSQIVEKSADILLQKSVVIHTKRFVLTDI